MVTDKKEPKTISQAFSELQQARSQYEIENQIKTTKHHKSKKKSYDVYYTGSISEKSKRNKAINQDKLSFKEWIQYRINKIRYDRKEIKKVALITTGMFVVCITVISSNYILAKSAKEEEIKQKIATNVFETNNESLNIQKIIIENVEITKSKTIIEDEEREVPYNVKRQDNSNLPKGEEVTVQEGVFGKKLVDCIKSYEDSNYMGEKILDETVVVDPVDEVIDVGTSEFLAKLKIHLGDTVYVTKTVGLKETASDTANNLCLILDSLDVKIDELTDATWCKVTYGSQAGYLKQEDLTSEALTPGIGEKNRKQKINATLDANMDLTKPSGLSLEDYKKILSGNPLDTKKIIQNNAENFYRAEQKYKINGIFLASIAIHESAWGTSKIAQDKKNLFGFGAYDSSPYESANTFDDYGKGIDAVAKYLAKNYLYPAGTKIVGTAITTVNTTPSTNTAVNTTSTNTTSNTVSNTTANTVSNTTANTTNTANTNTTTNTASNTSTNIASNNTLAASTTTAITTQPNTETATGTYYNGPTISGVNTRYCTDKEWAAKIFKYMEMLYNRL
ncbi:MAG: G5 domain-containing protein [Clostridia bacterium]|nr:G5 domain-containing protein [Clostridia bacterium]